MIIIALSGKKHSGKNTVATMIGQMADCSVIEFAFADELKMEVCRAFGVSLQGLHRDKETFRELLQVWGCLRRKQNENHWLDKVIVKLLNAPQELALVTDVRFPNELNTMKEFGTVVRIIRDTGFVDKHESETALDQYDFSHVLQNNGSLPELREQVRTLLHKLQIPTKHVQTNK